MTNPVRLNYSASVLQAMEIASTFVGETIPVINEENGRMVELCPRQIFLMLILRLSHAHDLEHG